MPACYPKSVSASNYLFMFRIIHFQSAFTVQQKPKELSSLITAELIAVLGVLQSLNESGLPCQIPVSRIIMYELLQLGTS